MERTPPRPAVVSGVFGTESSSPQDLRLSRLETYSFVSLKNEVWKFELLPQQPALLLPSVLFSCDLPT